MQSQDSLGHRAVITASGGGVPQLPWKPGQRLLGGSSAPVQAQPRLRHLGAGVPSEGPT